jgi:hypothetical protein
MTNTLRAIWLVLLILGAALLMVGAWGLAAVLLLGYTVNPDALGRAMDDGSPTWPWQIGIVLILLLIGAGGLRLTQRAVRRWKAPRPALTPKAPRVRRATEKAKNDTTAPGRRVETAPRAARESQISVRTKLFLLAALALSIGAVFAGMIGEWMGGQPQGFTGPGTLLGLATLCLSFALGVAYANRLKVGRAERATIPMYEDGDIRPVLIFIWWPITVISVFMPLLVLYFAATRDIAEGSGLPTGITLVVGVFGFVSLPPVVSVSIAEFSKRRIRGFWRAARNTEWGDGGA